MEIKYQRPQVEVQCDYCGAILNKDKSEVRRNERLKRNNYCSNKCAGKTKTEHLKKFHSPKGTLRYLSGRTKDKYSLFRTHLRRAKRRNKHLDLTLQDIKETWEEQRGICPYLKIPLLLPEEDQENDPVRTASLDRKDSTKGYTKDNIQFVSMCMNFMKHTMTEKQMQEALNIIRN